MGIIQLRNHSDVGVVRSKPTRYWYYFGEPIALGLSMGAVIGLVAGGGTQDPGNSLSIPPAWQGLLASFGAGVREEIWFRFGLMTLFVWLVAKTSNRFQKGSVAVSPANVRLGNTLAAIAFSMAHLPQAQGLLGLDTFVILLVMLGNGLPGLVFGWLFWHRGLRAAALAHFSFDIILKVILPLLTTT
jgi:Type II CAAX prenyl endopeptidase Rce1-like